MMKVHKLLLCKWFCKYSWRVAYDLELLRAAAEIDKKQTAALTLTFKMIKFQKWSQMIRSSTILNVVDQFLASLYLDELNSAYEIRFFLTWRWAWCQLPVTSQLPTGYKEAKQLCDCNSRKIKKNEFKIVVITHWKWFKYLRLWIYF